MEFPIRRVNRKILDRMKRIDRMAGFTSPEPPLPNIGEDYPQRARMNADGF
jgi:hypothetical protein